MQSVTTKSLINTSALMTQPSLLFETRLILLAKTPPPPCFITMHLMNLMKLICSSLYHIQKGRHHNSDLVPCACGTLYLSKSDMFVQDHTLDKLKSADNKGQTLQTVSSILSFFSFKGLFHKQTMRKISGR